MGLVLIPKNFRPVSNLTYLSKLIERVVCAQISEMAEKSGNTEPLQSAYKRNHSTETALLKVKADILQAMDNQRVVCLILLDLSAAFDTVNHQLLLNRLKYRFGFGGVILDWIRFIHQWNWTECLGYLFALQDSSMPLKLTLGSFFLLFHLGLLFVQLDLTS